MKKFIFLLAILALALMTVPAMADTYTLNYGTSTNPNFNTANNDEDYGYGAVYVNLTNSTHATVRITPLTTGNTPPTSNDFIFINGSSAYLNVAGTASYTIPNGWSATGTQPPQPPVSLGSFDVSLYRTGSTAATTILFTLTATNGTTWADAAHVLETNAAGFSVAAYVEENYAAVSFPKGYIALGSPVDPVPIPPSALLLGSGLLGLGAMGWRRKQG
jgi:hypothetical protein